MIALRRKKNAEIASPSRPHNHPITRVFWGGCNTFSAATLCPSRCVSTTTTADEKVTREGKIGTKEEEGKGEGKKGEGNGGWVDQDGGSGTNKFRILNVNNLQEFYYCTKDVHPICYSVIKYHPLTARK